MDFIFPEIPEWQAAKRSLENETIGKIFAIKMEWKFFSYDLKNHIRSWKTDVKKGGGALSFYFSHSFNYLEYFIGRIKEVQCVCHSSELSLNKGETRVTMNLLFENGCVGKADMDICYHGQQKHVIEFQGERGLLKLQNNSNNLVDNFELIIDSDNVTQKIKPIEVLDSSLDESEDLRVKVVKPVAERFIDWCNTGVAAKPDFKDGLRVQELIDLARFSASKGTDLII